MWKITVIKSATVGCWTRKWRHSEAKKGKETGKEEVKDMEMARGIKEEKEKEVSRKVEEKEKESLEKEIYLIGSTIPM